MAFSKYTSAFSTLEVFSRNALYKSTIHITLLDLVNAAVYKFTFNVCCYAYFLTVMGSN